MILDEFVEIKWSRRLKSHFIKKGYIFTKIGDIFMVRVEDLNIGSHVVINVRCDFPF